MIMKDMHNSLSKKRICNLKFYNILQIIVESIAQIWQMQEIERKLAKTS